jgi:diguanylate cyclase (GGDEF)-like protein
MLDVFCADLLGRIFWSKMEYLGANTASPLFLLFFLNYPSSRLRLSPIQIALLFALPLVTIFMVMTNEWHYLFWTGFTPLPGSENAFIFHHGPFYWLALTYNYLCRTISVALIIRNLLQFHGLFRFQSAVLLVSSAFPYFAGLAYSFGFNPFPALDILPLAFSLAGLGIVFSTVFLHMFDRVPIGRNLLVEKMQDGLIVINQRHQVVEINPAALNLLAPVSLQLGDSIVKAGDRIATQFANMSPRAEIEMDGLSPRCLELMTTPLIDQMENQIGTLGIIRDITEISQMKQRLQEMATHDALTGLPNRILFFDRFNLAVANALRNNKKLAVLSLDVDNFKDINDNFGHPFGDRVLVEVGQRLTGSLRMIDTVARFGGDEFMVLLWEINSKTDAVIVAQKILGDFQQPFMIDGQKITLTASLGIAVYPENGKDIQDLIKKSDKSLYHAKENSGDNYQLYDELFNP